MGQYVAIRESVGGAGNRQIGPHCAALPAIRGERLGYLPSLDGLRALAVLVVVAHHAGVPGFGGGFIGVDAFFVLSGYLITRLLAETRPTLGQFYWRRWLRLTPPLALMLVAYVAVFAVAAPGYPHGRDALVAGAYLSDYAKGYWSLPDFIGHTWSLSVEEHFYLLWPLVFYRFKPNAPVIFAAYCAASFWRYSHPEWYPAYYTFDGHCSGLILGCFIASLPRDKFPAWPGLLWLAWMAHSMYVSKNRMGYDIAWIECAAAWVVLGKAPAWMASKPLAYLGKLSYGIYLWHFPIVQLCRLQHMGWLESLAWSLGGSVVLAAVSYHTVEAIVRSTRKKAPARENRGS